MTLRITLLVLVTGLFTMIWTHDQPAPTASTKQSLPLAQTSEPSPSAIAEETAISRSKELFQVADRNETAPTRSRPVSQAQIATEPIPEIPMDELWMFNACEMPLPAGIVPGEYRAVSNTGMVRHLNLTLEDLQSYHQVQSGFVTREVYQSGEESLRWYFIRVQSDSLASHPVIAERGTSLIRPAVAERGVSLHVPAVAERSQTERIQRQASQIIVNAGQRIASRLIRFSTQVTEKTRL